MQRSTIAAPVDSAVRAVAAVVVIVRRLAGDVIAGRGRSIGASVHRGRLIVASVVTVGRVRTIVVNGVIAEIVRHVTTGVVVIARIVAVTIAANADRACIVTVSAASVVRALAAQVVAARHAVARAAVRRKRAAPSVIVLHVNARNRRVNGPVVAMP